MTLFTRIIAAIRTAQWHMLLMELLVVAAGLFLGFQLDRWYEDRQDQVKAVRYIERLTVNITEDLEVLERVRSLASIRLSYTELIHRASHDPDFVIEDPTEFVLATEQALYRFALVPHDATFRELLANGDMALLPEAIRDALYAYHGELGVRTQFFSTYANNQAEALRRFAGIIDFDQIDPFLSNPGRTRRQYSPEEAQVVLERLRQRPEALAWLPRLRMGHQQTLWTTEIALEKATEIKTLLESAGR